MTISARLPAVRSLSKILPDGTEGGKEFARVVGLLLLSEAKRTGLEFSMFDDASGDYEGLDSFSRKPKSKDVVGYQYKFFPSPLSDAHRQQVRASLQHALDRSKRLKLIKWVLVTPDDFKNSGRRINSGDVEWFDKLRDDFKNKVEIEHIGHSKLQALFMQAPYLCLFYYPTLIQSGNDRRKSIQELRGQYDLNMRTRYGRIEFVGMSVYKEEASRRIPLEDIYIPLSVVPERSTEETDETPRVNPTSFLISGAKTVILGDPGSGKSTLLAFLALVGISESLQSRCKYSADGRLTIVVTLRRYADELKTRNNLPLLDYIVEVAKADFNICSLDKSFYEYYLETGQAIVFFDGLDELPGAGYKTTVRKRIESFTTSYPANTIVVTSRLVGYEAEARFDDTYEHFRVAKLRVTEIERFITDWYTARIEDEAEKQRNSQDLIRVITHPDSESIRALARNPLLLTIVALVHRIDAVLPDQRVVLYQKCTETLLNTWYKAKRRDEDAIKGRVERRNRLRIEAIAYWMHKKSLGEQGRSVAPRQEILNFLTAYISENEKLKESDDPSEDQAEVFLDFIKDSAGLLIEAGDGLYSFIHLTFQEYLCATHLAAFGETGGAQSIWKELKGDLQNPRWREVVRLLVASLRSTSAQAFFVNKLLSEKSATKGRDTVLLLIGLLRDAIEPAELCAEDIVTRALETLQSQKKLNDIRTIDTALRAWALKNEANLDQVMLVWRKLFDQADDRTSLILALIRPSVGLPSLVNAEEVVLNKRCNSPELAIFRSLILRPGKPSYSDKDLIGLNYAHALWALDNPEANAAAAIGFCLSILLTSSHGPRRLLIRQIALISVDGYGPSFDHTMNLLAIGMPSGDIHPIVTKALENALLNRNIKRNRERPETVLAGLLGKHIKPTPRTQQNKVNRGDKLIRIFEPGLSDLAAKFGVPNSVIALKDKLREGNSHTRELYFARESFAEKMNKTPNYYWDTLRSSDIFDGLLESLQVCLDIKLPPHWKEAVQITLEQSVPDAIAKYFDQREWVQLNDRLSKNNATESDIDFAAWLILFDIWIWARNGYVFDEPSPLENIINTARSLKNPILDFSLAIHYATQKPKEGATVLNRLLSSPHSDVKNLLIESGWPLWTDGEIVVSPS